MHIASDPGSFRQRGNPLAFFLARLQGSIAFLHHRNGHIAGALPVAEEDDRGDGEDDQRQRACEH